MLEARAIFKEDGTLDFSEIPSINQGDNNSIKLYVSFYSNYATKEFLDLTNYVVEAVVERPDGSVSPALTLSIDTDSTKKYLKINNWITEFEGTNKFTIRLKQGETIKATGFLNVQVGGGNVPADTVITEPQHEALQEAIQAEETARAAETEENRENIEGLNDRVNYIEDTVIPNLSDRIDGLNGQITSVDNKANANAEAIENAHTRIATNEGSINTLGANVQTLNNNIEKKLDKQWDSVPLINNLANDDYFVLNSGSKVYKITVENLKLLLGVGTGETSGVNHYKGDYLTYEALVSANPSAEAGDYAFVNTTTANGDLLVMYIWDSDANTWKETKSGQYVLSSSFVDFQNALLNGSVIVKKADGAYKYITETGEEINIETAFENIEQSIEETTQSINNINQNITNLNNTIANKQDKLTEGNGIKITGNTISVEFPEDDDTDYYSNATPTPAALGGIAKGTTFDNKPISEVLNMLLYPYVAFSASMSTSPSGGVKEKGTSFTLTSATVNITLGSAAISSISIVSSLNESTVIASKTSGITAGSNVISLPNTVVSANQTIKAIITDATGASKTISSTAFTFVDPYYYGAIGADAELTETLIKGLTKDVKTKGNKSYTINMTQQKAVIAYPASYGSLTTILDANGFNVTETFVRNTLTINGVSYYVYVLDSAATSSMKYTFNY